ncbi:MAG: outer membrane beta-barrel protein [Bacteroidia bacterium]|nr:outer membrane beta-barrel protein [Bacteroidia bacterium]MCO5252837.1 PorT family protein [Bacteroidota bacterium]
MLGFSYTAKSAEGDKAFQLGLTGSANFGWTSRALKPASPNGLGLGYSIGITGDWNLVKSKSNYFLSFDFLSTNLRTRIKLTNSAPFLSKKDSFNYENIEHTFKLTYVEIPISLKLKINEIGYFTWFAQFGISPGILYRTQAKFKAERVGSHDKLTTEYFNNNSGEDDDVKQEFTEFNDNIRFYRIATFIGAGMEYRFSGNTAFVASLRFNNGLNDILSDKKAAAHNTFIALHAGILF